MARRGTVTQAVKGTTTSARKRTARAFAPKGFRLRASAGRVRITLPKLGKGERVEIQRSGATKKAKFARIATSKAKTYLDRSVRRGRTYRYRDTPSGIRTRDLRLERAAS